MLASDFIYDGIRLSEKGYIICDFDNKTGVEFVNIGSKISFNKIKRDSGRIYTLASATYDECVTATFDICKDDCLFNNNEMEITTLEFRELTQWLNRREFLPFRIVDEDQTVCWYNASFNIEKIIIGGRVYGARLTMETDRPFGYDDEVTEEHKFGNSTSTHFFTNYSNEIGYIYPLMTIECLGTGDLSIKNDFEDCTTTIKKCTIGEIITLNGETQSIKTSMADNHTRKNIHNDFNWEFMRLGTKMRRGYPVRANHFSVTQPCKIRITYRPIVKDVP